MLELEREVHRLCNKSKGTKGNTNCKRNKLPTNLVESGGVNLNDQDKIFNNAGAEEITNRSKLGIPTISLVFGNATAGGAYVQEYQITQFFRKRKQRFSLLALPW